MNQFALHIIRAFSLGLFGSVVTAGTFLGLSFITGFSSPFFHFSMGALAFLAVTMLSLAVAFELTNGD